mgnify:CR=1 FL=1
MAYMVGLDMGTTYTRIWTQEGGVVLRCPSAAAIDSETHKLVALGVKALKWDPFGKSYLEISNKDLNTALECVAAVREAVGKEVDLLIEGHGRFNVPTGIKIAKELEQFKPMFFEEPVPPDGLLTLKNHKNRPSAGTVFYCLFLMPIPR